MYVSGINHVHVHNSAVYLYCATKQNTAKDCNVILFVYFSVCYLTHRSW